MAEQIEMPTTCDECGGLWDLNSLYSTWTNRLVCLPCKRVLDAVDDDDLDDE